MKTTFALAIAFAQASQLQLESAIKHNLAESFDRKDSEKSSYDRVLREDQKMMEELTSLRKSFADL
jgi:hypothetical protein